jgi:hypothetical protein
MRLRTGSLISPKKISAFIDFVELRESEDNLQGGVSSPRNPEGIWCGRAREV